MVLRKTTLYRVPAKIQTVVQIQMVHIFMGCDAALSLQVFRRNLLPSSSLSMLKKEVVAFSIMVVSSYLSIRRHISEDVSQKQSGIRIPWKFSNDLMLTVLRDD